VFFNLKVTCFGLGTEHHQNEKYTIFKRQVRIQYTKHHPVLCGI